MRISHLRTAKAVNTVPCTCYLPWIIPEKPLLPQKPPTSKKADAISSWYLPWVLPTVTPKPPVITKPPIVPDQDSNQPKTFDEIRPDDMSNLIKFISSDYFEGRESGTKKGAEFAHWLADAFAKRGLKGGGPKGSFFQQVSGAGGKFPENGVADSNPPRAQNVIGILEGSDPKLKNEYILYTGHWDHLGKDNSAQKDKIYNGAVDNGTGLSMMLEIAEKFKNNRPKRSIVFVGFTGEEEGLYGSKTFAEHVKAGKLPFQSYQIVGGINLDMIIPKGKSRDLAVIGYGMPEYSSGLMPLLETSLHAQGRTISPDPVPEEDYYLRSDHYSLVELLGTPMLLPYGGMDLVNGGRAAGKKAQDDYMNDVKNKKYHQKSDEWDPNWYVENKTDNKIDGLVEDAQVYYDWGQKLANSDAWPEWDANSSYRVIREQDLARKPLS